MSQRGNVGQFLQPTSAGLMVLAAVVALGVTASTALVWDRQGWPVARVAGPLLSLVLLVVATLIAINLSTSLFDTWSEVWVFLR